MAEIRLSEKKCQPCEGGIPPLTNDQAEDFLRRLKSGWELLSGAREIRREYKFKNFKETMGFVNLAAAVAEKEGHHPDMEVSWGKCVIRLSTHAIKGLSENDFILAAKIDAISA
ncbi:MAG: 4a-hydroxytetrahydrobiopterin dehydratase [Candidatus Omnitrophica bacterium]|nr:4a-hydroxytetrahydrobiopterin dehydratase [Candidatus Omnitrophota bacterium]